MVLRLVEHVCVLIANRCIIRKPGASGNWSSGTGGKAGRSLLVLDTRVGDDTAIQWQFTHNIPLRPFARRNQAFDEPPWRNDEDADDAWLRVAARLFQFV